MKIKEKIVQIEIENKLIKIDDFDFYKYDFIFKQQNCKTGIISNIITKVDWLLPIKFTKSNSLVLEDKYGNLLYVPKNCWDSIDSPYFKQNSKYGLFARLKNLDVEYDEIIKIMSTIKKYY